MCLLSEEQLLHYKYLLVKTLLLIFISFCDAEYFERLFSDLKPIDGFHLVSDTWDENEWYFEQRSCWRLGSLQNMTC